MSDKEDIGALTRYEYDRAIGSSWSFICGGLALGVATISFNAFQLYSVIKNPPHNAWVEIFPGSFASAILAVFAVSAVAYGLEERKRAKEIEGRLQGMEPRYMANSSL